MRIDEIMRFAPVIPVLVMEDPKYARPIAQALVAGGLSALEVTLRTPAALDVIAEMANVEGAVIGAGTVVDEAQLDAATAAGAKFVVAPGFTDRLTLAALERDSAYLPGVASASDIMRGLDFGLSHFKFFPAEASGGVAMLKALAGPFPRVRFCPTGGITPANAVEYLSLDNVLCVGGTWLIGPDLPDSQSIEQRARLAACLSTISTSGGLH